MFELTANLAVQDQSARLDYRVRNQTADGAFFFNVPTDALFTAYPQTAYACLTEDDQALHLLLGQSPVPTGVSVLVAVLPFATYLAPGQEGRDSIVLEFPVREWHAYARRDYPEAGARLVRVSRVVFSLEYVLEKDLQFREPRTDWGDVFYVGGYPVGRLEARLQADRPIPVLKRGDVFQRF